MAEYIETDHEESSKDFVSRCCDGPFERLESVGGKAFAIRIFKDAFWFAYDGENRPDIPDSALSWLLPRLDGARMLLDAFIEAKVLKSE